MAIGISKETRGANEWLKFEPSKEYPFVSCVLVSVSLQTDYKKYNDPNPHHALHMDFSGKDHNGIVRGFRRTMPAPDDITLDIGESADKHNKDVVQARIGMSILKEFIQAYTGLAKDKIEILGQTWNDVLESIVKYFNTEKAGKSIYENVPIWIKITYKIGDFNSEKLDFVSSPFVEIAKIEGDKVLPPKILSIDFKNESLFPPVKKEATKLNTTPTTDLGAKADMFFPK